MFVCDECVGLCNEIIDEEEFLNVFPAQDERNATNPLRPPSRICAAGPPTS